MTELSTKIISFLKISSVWMILDEFKKHKNGQNTNILCWQIHRINYREIYCKKLMTRKRRSIEIITCQLEIRFTLGNVTLSRGECTQIPYKSKLENLKILQTFPHSPLRIPQIIQGQKPIRKDMFPSIWEQKRIWWKSWILIKVRVGHLIWCRDLIWPTILTFRKLHMVQTSTVIFNARIRSRKTNKWSPIKSETNLESSKVMEKISARPGAL